MHSGIICQGIVEKINLYTSAFKRSLTNHFNEIISNA